MRPLSDAEWDVMKAVWEQRETTVRQVCEELAAGRKWAYNTVKTFMERLEAKGYLKVRKEGKTYSYRPAVTQRTATRRAFRYLIDRVLDGATAPLVSYLVEGDKLSDDEIEQLRALVERQATKRKPKKGG